MSPRKYKYVLESISVEENERYYVCEFAPRCPGAGKKVFYIRGEGFVLTRRHIHQGYNIISYDVPASLMSQIEVFINGSIISSNLHEDTTVFHECVEDDINTYSVVKPYIELLYRLDPNPIIIRGFPDERVLPEYYVPFYGEDQGDENQQDVILNWPFPMTIATTKLRSVQRKGIHRRGHVIVANVSIARAWAMRMASPVLTIDPNRVVAVAFGATIRPRDDSPPLENRGHGFCMVCHSTDATYKYVVIPCGHSWMCRSCVVHRLRSCPVCRVDVIDYLRVLETSF